MMNVDSILHLMGFTPDVTNTVVFDMLCCSFIHDAALRLWNNNGSGLSWVGMHVQKVRLELVRMSTIESFGGQTTIAMTFSWLNC